MKWKVLIWTIKKILAALDLFLCKEKFKLMYVCTSERRFKFGKKNSRSLSPEISMLRRSLKVNLFFKSRILRAGSLFFSEIWGLVLYTTVLYRTILRVWATFWGSLFAFMLKIFFFKYCSVAPKVLLDEAENN